MPLYEYACESCGHRFERIQKFSDPPVSECPKCGQPVRKLLSSPAIQFKGTGWYVTDYAKSGGSVSGKSASGSDATASGAEKSTEAKSETKSDTSTASKSESKPAPASSGTDN